MLRGSEPVCADWSAAIRASMRSRCVDTSSSVGSFAGKSISVEPTTELNVLAPEVAVMSMVVPWIDPVTWKV